MSREKKEEKLSVEGMRRIDEEKKKLWWARPELVGKYNNLVDTAERLNWLSVRFDKEVFDFKDIERGWMLLDKIVDLMSLGIVTTEGSGYGVGVLNARERMRQSRKRILAGKREWDVLMVRRHIRKWMASTFEVSRHLRKIIEWGNEEKESDFVEEVTPPLGCVIGGVIENISAEEERTYYDEVAEYSVEDDDLSYGRLVGAVNVLRYEMLRMHNSGVSFGVDVARYGEDRSVIAVEQWGHIVDIRSFPRLDTMETCGRVVEAVREYKPEDIKVEVTGGLGAGVYDRLREIGIGCKVIPLEVQAGPKQERLKAANLRSELYLNLEERLRLGTLSLPPDKELAEELVHTRYDIRSDGKIWIRPKEEIRKALGRSPDRADAVACCAYRMPSARVYM
jgi:hypothetical protein